MNKQSAKPTTASKKKSKNKPKPDEKLTWIQPAWSEGSLAGKYLPQLRDRWGLEAARIIEETAQYLDDERDSIRAEDVRRVLESIARDPEGVQLARLDSLTLGLLTSASITLYRIEKLEALSREGLVACANRALSDLELNAGRPETYGVRSRMLKMLDGLWSASLREEWLKRHRAASGSGTVVIVKAGKSVTTRQEENYLRKLRMQLFKDALRACNSGDGDKTIEALLLTKS
jgi:hypothetical protein